jgi:hypothetical protein
MPATATARAELEALLRERQLDRTVTRAELSGQGMVPTGVAGLDEAIGGGFPRGELSEIAGPRSSGRSSVLSSALAATTTTDGIAALVDALDMFDVESGSNAGIRLDRLLWIRGDAISRHPESPAASGARWAGLKPCPTGVAVEAGHRLVEAGVSRLRGRSLGGERLAAADPWARALDRAVKAVNLVLQAGGFDLVVLDLGEVLPEAIRRLPFTTWFRLQRTLEGSRTACVVVAPMPVARSAGGVTVLLNRATAGSHQPASRQPAAGSHQPAASCGQPPARWSGRPGEVRLLLGFDLDARVIRSREAAGGTCRFAVNT